MKPYKTAKPRTRNIPKMGIRWELLIPTITALLTVIVGSLVNAYQARQLERQKFQFEVIKFTLSAKSEGERVGLLCQFSELGFIDDPNRIYHRHEVDGIRPCENWKENKNSTTSKIFSDLKSQIGIGHNGQITFERGLVKIGGGLSDYRDLTDVQFREMPVETISIISLVSAESAWNIEELKANRAAKSSHIIIQRDGHIVQARNLSDRPLESPITVALQNAGKLTFRTEGKGPMFQLRDQFGRIVPREEGVGFVSGTTTVGRQRFSAAQIAKLDELMEAACMRWPALRVNLESYVSQTLEMQRAARSKLSCN